MALEKPQIDKPEGDIPFDLGIEEIVVGDGDEAVSGSKVAVHYVGVSFSTGDEFDASWNRGEAFKFKLGAGNVIPGTAQVSRDAVMVSTCIACARYTRSWPRM